MVPPPTSIAVSSSTLRNNRHNTKHKHNRKPQQETNHRSLPRQTCKTPAHVPRTHSHFHIFMLSCLKIITVQFMLPHPCVTYRPLLLILIGAWITLACGPGQGSTALLVIVYSSWVLDWLDRWGPGVSTRHRRKRHGVVMRLVYITR